MSRCARDADLVLAPWAHDAHPDHEALGRAARTAAALAGVPLLAFPVWAWQWAVPGDAPGAVGPGAARAGTRRTSGRPSGRPSTASSPRCGPWAPHPRRRRCWRRRCWRTFDRDVEVVFRMSLPGSYFDDLYAGDDDPWSLRTRWYEQRK